MIRLTHLAMLFSLTVFAGLASGQKVAPPKLENRAEWKLTASHGAKHLGSAVDGKMATRYSTDESMRPGMWIQIELPKEQQIAGVSFELGRSKGDFARSYVVELSADDENWREVASGTGKPLENRILFEKQPAKFLKVTQTGSSEAYWSAHEIHVFADVDPRIAAFNATPVHRFTTKGEEQAKPKGNRPNIDTSMLKPYDGLVVKEVNTSTLTGKVMAGYQGWFNCDGDGMGLGWKHWRKSGGKPIGPGNVSFDLWPDVSEMDADELYETEFKNPDNNPAKLFSSANRKTVLRHFEWMQQYQIDGVFLQRFANGIVPNSLLVQHKNTVLGHVREGANSRGRAYALMYDLSGLRREGTRRVYHDWRMLRHKMRLGEDHAYLKHRGKPLVAIWGVGFNDDREYTLAECRDLILALKADGCSIMLGVPTGWRNLERDAKRTPVVHEVLKLADVISPWTPGRYRSPIEATRHAAEIWAPDKIRTQKNGQDYLPVVFPGFSWKNLKGGDESLGAIPRLKGQFLWSQLIGAKRADADMIYVAMFDEVDEGTAIFKCTNTPPTSDFLTYEGLPSDHYLKLTAKGAAMLRGEIPVSEQMPDLGN